MSNASSPPTPPVRGEVLRKLRNAAALIGAVALIRTLGFTRFDPGWTLWEGRLFIGLALLLPVLAGFELLRRRPERNWRDAIVPLTLGAATWCGAALLAIEPLGARLAELLEFDRVSALAAVWFRLAVLGWVLLGLLDLFRRVSLAGWNPATIVATSFLLLILAGTGLLTLPFARPEGAEPADWNTALFTSTSAVCVTGLAVVDTGTYWSRGGQWVILGLVQCGGLGIMAFGAFFSLLVGRGLLMRESSLLKNLLERNVLSDVRGMLTAMVTATFACEAIGAVLLSGLWSHLPWRERAFQSVFHAVSAFCNAGFGLAPNNFEGLGHRWQVWGVLSALIILGGLGFGVLYDAAVVLRDRLFRRGPRTARLSISSRLALITTALLLAAGAVLFYGLERDGEMATLSEPERAAHAWFQSVTCRTAGFNTVKIGRLSDSTLLMMIVLMYAGASPGSTGGGVKTVPLAVCLLTLRAVLRGRTRVEAYHRTISEGTVFRAGLIAALMGGLIVLFTWALTLTESETRFLPYLFEATSALGTVGLTADVTGSLSTSGRCLMTLAMFLGRIGPLTLLVALAGGAARERYRYPETSLTLG